MKERARWFFLLVVIFVVVVLSGAGLVLYLTHRGSTAAQSSLSVVWKVSGSDFTQQDEQAIEKAVQDSIATQARNVPRPAEIDIISAQRQGDWATFSTQQHMSSSTPALGTEPGFFIAHKQGSSWSLLLPGTPNFCNQLQQVPDTLLAPVDKSYFCQ